MKRCNKRESAGKGICRYIVKYSPSECGWCKLFSCLIAISGQFSYHWSEAEWVDASSYLVSLGVGSTLLHRQPNSISHLTEFGIPYPHERTNRAVLLDDRVLEPFWKTVLRVFYLQGLSMTRIEVRYLACLCRSAGWPETPRLCCSSFILTQIFLRTLGSNEMRSNTARQMQASACLELDTLPCVCICGLHI